MIYTHFILLSFPLSYEYSFGRAFICFHEYTPPEDPRWFVWRGVHSRLIKISISGIWVYTFKLIEKGDLLSLKNITVINMLDQNSFRCN
jgi:hypothetical protein